MPNDNPPTLRARRQWLGHALAFPLLLAAGLPEARAANLQLGQPAPPLVLHSLDGRLISTRDLLGHVVLATFWATWCDACREELPMLSAYAERHAAQGLQVLGFCLDGSDALEDVRREAAKLSFPVGLLGSPWAGRYGRIWRLPVSFVIDRKGLLRYDGWKANQPALDAATLSRVVTPLLL